MIAASGVVFCAPLVVCAAFLYVPRRVISPPSTPALRLPFYRSTIRKAAAAAEVNAETTAKRKAIVAAYKKGQVSSRDLADKYGMSQSAVARLISGKSAVDSKRGRQLIVPPEIEEKLVKAMIRCADAHVGFGPKAMRAAVGFFMTKAGLAEEDYEMGEGWYASFMNRHKHQLSSLRSRSISKSRSFGFNRIVVEDWFDFVEPLAAKFTKEETFNCDDTGFDMEIDTGRVIGATGGGQPQKRAAECKKGHIGATLCAPAAGPPMRVLWTFKGERAEHDYGAGTSDVFVMTFKGWATPGTYYRFAELFVAMMRERKLKKALLYADNADIHINEETCELFKKNNVTCVGLIPAATHKHQPWDVAGIQNIKKKMKPWAAAHRIPYTKENIMRIFRACIDEVTAARAKEGKFLLQGGFVRTGLFPFNKGVFKHIDYAASDAHFGLDDPEELARARDVTSKRWAALRDTPLNTSLAEYEPDTRDALGAGAKLAQRKRLSAMLGKLPGALDDQGRLDAAEAVADRVWTSESFTQHKAAARAAKAAETEARKQKAADAAAAAQARAAANAQRAADTSAKRAAASKARSEAQAAKAAKKAAKEAERAAKQPVQQPQLPLLPPVLPQKRKRRADEGAGVDEYARRYIKKARR